MTESTVTLKRTNGGAAWLLLYQDQELAELAPWEAAETIKRLLAGELAAVAQEKIRA